MPIFQRHNVKLVGVGVEPLGVEEFIEGKFFDGGIYCLHILYMIHDGIQILKCHFYSVKFVAELFIDMDKSSFNNLGFTRFGFFGLFPAVFSSAARAFQSRVRKINKENELLNLVLIIITDQLYVSVIIKHELKEKINNPCA